MAIFTLRHAAALLLAFLLFGCGGGSDGTSGSGTSGSGTSGSGTSGSGTSGSGTSGSGTSGSGTSGSGTSSTAASVALVAKLGKPSRVLVGLGAGNSLTQMQSQSIHPDIVDTYLVGVGAGAWPTWNSPDGAYITYTAQAVQAYGATPMFTFYQMAQNGGGNLSGINDATFMNNYWGQARLMYQRIAALNAPVLINLEPDFWGFVWAQAPGHDPAQMPAVVSSQAECSGLPNTAAGVGQCLVQMGRKIAPNALLGFPPSFWGTSPTAIATEMQAAGANLADFIVAQTSDRDAGCMEVASPPSECAGRTGSFYWDEANIATPNFHQSQSAISDYRAALGNGLPILWWQTPMGVPSATPGGTNQHYRDNHVDYMLRNTQEYGDSHTFAIVFSSGGTFQTSISSDGGQFARLLSQYLTQGGATLR
ncbi:hypothetical protein [Collimonas arenae]|uniref:hypothetical protein n=1 Tax=Collimonas arenae TaxID=279058 RepID=UPI001F27BEE6|nr:hypothetical protein [Collimonas arenae]